MTAKPRRAAEPVTGLLNQTALDDATLNQLREWDPRWAEACQKMSTSPLIDGVLPRKVAELIGMAVSMGCSQNHPEETQRHIRAAVEAGAARDEILMVLKMATLTSIRSISIGTTILVKEASMEELDVAAIGRAAKSRRPETRQRRLTRSRPLDFGTRIGSKYISSLQSGWKSS